VCIRLTLTLTLTLTVTLTLTLTLTLTSALTLTLTLNPKQCRVPPRVHPAHLPTEDGEGRRVAQVLQG
jgi:hypothetical protein